MAPAKVTLGTTCFTCCDRLSALQTSHLIAILCGCSVMGRNARTVISGFWPRDMSCGTLPLWTQGHHRGHEMKSCHIYMAFCIGPLQRSFATDGCLHADGRPLHGRSRREWEQLRLLCACTTDFLQHVRLSGLSAGKTGLCVSFPFCRDRSDSDLVGCTGPKGSHRAVLSRVALCLQEKKLAECIRQAEAIVIAACGG